MIDCHVKIKTEDETAKRGWHSCVRDGLQMKEEMKDKKEEGKNHK